MSATPTEALAEWRGRVEEALKGQRWESLRASGPGGIEIEPLYWEPTEQEGVPWARTGLAIGRCGDAAVLADLEPGAMWAWAIDDGVALVRAERRAERAILEPSGDLEAVLGAARSGDRVLSEAHGDPARCRAVAGALGRGAHALAARDPETTDPVLDLALVLSSLVGSLRSLEDAGVDLERAIDGATIATATGTDLFLEIAKLRALRRLLGRVLEACALSARPLVAARTSTRGLALIDSPTNILRNTLAAGAAILGGADVVAVLPHEGGSSAARLATQTALVLSLEGHLDAPDDPGRGSYYLEHLTAAVTERGWARFQELERLGGVTRARAWIDEQVGAARAAHDRAVALRRTPLVGVSRFPGETSPADPRFVALLDRCGAPRDARRFEDLRRKARERSSSAQVLVLPGCPEPRVQFAVELLAIAGIEPKVRRHGPATDASAPIAIVCAPDATLASGEEVPVAVRGLAGARIAIAGRPAPEREAELRAAGVHVFAHLGADVITTLAALLEPA